MKEQGRTAWEALHQMRSATRESLMQWLSEMVPAFECGCQEWAKDYIKRNAPPYENDEAFFEWTYYFHDAADIKTGDSRMTLEQAKERWGR